MTDAVVYKVAVITPNPTPYRAPFFARLAQEPGIDLTVFFLTRGSATRPWNVGGLDFRHEFLKEYSIPVGGKDMARYRINPAIISRLASGCFDVVVIAGYNHFTTQAAIVYCTLARTPWCIMSESHVRKRRGRLKTFVKNLFLKPLLSRMGAAMVTGTLAGHYVQAFGVPPEATFVVANTPDVRHLMRQADRLAPQRQAIREGMGLAGRRVVLFVGRLLKEKGLDVLFEACVRAKAAADDVVLLVVGDGRRQAAYKALAKKKGLADVQFLGFRSQAELPEIYAAADVFVLASLVEPWGVVVNEAMASGLPVILSDQVGASADLVVEGENGFVVPAGNPEALSARILDVLSDEARRAGMGRESRRIIANWDYSASIANFREALAAAMRRGGRRLE
ncbi:MAG: glycosyltransferase family 4 protein [Planctomycetes bacterium]|nr:glycosyltransferase family 4 protein [Planctomycetota bacterium]